MNTLPLGKIKRNKNMYPKVKNWVKFLNLLSSTDRKLGAGRGNRRRSGSSAKDDRKGNAWVDRRARRGTGRDAWEVCEQAKVSEGESMGCGSPPRRSINVDRFREGYALEPRLRWDKTKPIT